MFTKKLILAIGGALLCTTSLLYLLNSRITVTTTASNDELLVKDLQKYITIKTTHPTPAYKEAVQFLTSCAQRDGFISTIIKLPSGNPVIIITCQGTDQQLPSLLLNHHMDVVPVGDVKDWSVDPFAAKIINGVLIGRGTQDMKGIGMVHYHAMRQLLKEGLQPKRTIHLIAVPDEERGGFKGTKEFVQTDFFKTLHVGFVLDEGHASGNNGSLDIKVAERKPVQIEIVSSGKTEHGSHLLAHNCTHTLIDFLTALIKLHKQSQAQTTQLAPGQLISYNITSLKSGVLQNDGSTALNVIPAQAIATVDIRVPMGTPTASVIEQLTILNKQFPTITYTIKARAKEEPTTLQIDSPLYTALASAIKQHGLQPINHYFEGASDLRFYLDKNIFGLGLTPFTVEDNIHGIDESVPVKQLYKARDLMVTFLRKFCFD